VPLADLRGYETALYRFLETRHPAIVVRLGTGERIDEETALGLDAALEQFANVGAPAPTRAAA
jgi:hypothetical protein